MTELAQVTHVECGEIGHVPIVTVLHGEHVVTCSRCGLCLDFRPLHELGFNTSDWKAPEYEVPATRRIEP